MSSVRSQLSDLRGHHTMLQEDNQQYQEVLATLTAANRDLKRQLDQLRFDLGKASAPATAAPAPPVPAPPGPSPGDAAGSGRGAGGPESEVERLRSEREEVAEELEGVREEVVALRREKLALANRVEDVGQQIARLQDQHRSVWGGWGQGWEGGALSGLCSVS